MFFSAKKYLLFRPIYIYIASSGYNLSTFMFLLNLYKLNYLFHQNHII